MKRFYNKAIFALRPNASFVQRGSSYSGLEWLDKSSEKPSEQEIENKIQEFLALEPMRLLRIERDRKLTEVDWWTSRALDGTPLTTEQTAYRQALRDLPENSANVAIDENGTLINVEWPVKPE